MAKHSGLLDVRAGCKVCHGQYEAGWFSCNAAGVTARHDYPTGHPIWVEQLTGVWYGEPSGELSGDNKGAGKPPAKTQEGNEDGPIRIPTEIARIGAAGA